MPSSKRTNRKRVGRKGRRAYRKGLKKKAPSLYKAVKAIAKNEANKLVETKFNVSWLAVGGISSPQITNSLTSSFTLSPTDTSTLIPVLPPFIRGTNSDELVGSRVQMISGKTDFIISLLNTNASTINITVKLFCLESVKVKDYNIMTGLPKGYLLRTGNDTNADWVPSTAIGGYAPC